VHIPEDALEQYATRTLPDMEIEPLELHLFNCSECRDRLMTVLSATAGLPDTDPEDNAGNNGRA
jgi:hypothetical protein